MKALADQPVVQYSIAYPIGVIGVLLTFQALRRLWRIPTVETGPADAIQVKDFVVKNPSLTGRTLASLRKTGAAPFLISRVHHAGRTAVATPETTLEMGAVVSVVAEPDGQRQAAGIFGEPTAMRIEGDSIWRGP